ncbi:MAG: TolC family protein [Gemmatimonadales bacterium]
MLIRTCRLAGLVALLVQARPLRAQTPLTLPEAIRLAQSQGYRARAALAARDAARYTDRVFYSRLMPQLSLGGTVPSYNRSIIQVLQPDGSTVFRPQDQLSSSLTATVSQSLPVTGGDFFISSSLARLSVSGQQTLRTWSSTPVSVGLRQPIFRPNLRGWDRREQPVRAELAERQYREAREEIALVTTNLFFDAYSARVEFDNATKNAAVNDTLYTLNKGRFAVGRIGEDDLLQSELALLRARASADGARLDLERTLAALRLALNLPLATRVEIIAPTDVPQFEPDTAWAVTEALQNRAFASEAELQAVQARRRVTEAKLNNGMGATVEASYGFNATGPGVNAAYQNLLEARQFTLSVQVPLIQWGARKEAIQAAEADRERIVNTTRSSLEEMAQDAHFIALELPQARRNLSLSAKADTVAGRRFDVAYNRYVIGRIAIDNLYLAQSEKNGAVTQYVQALRGYWTAHYRLRLVTLFDFEAGQEIR